MYRVLATGAAAFALFQVNAAIAGPAKPYAPHTSSSGYRLTCTVGHDGLSVVKNVGRFPIRRGAIYVSHRFGKFDPAATKPRAVSVGYGLPVNGTIRVAQPKGATSCSATLSTRDLATRLR